jgi:glycosyltransferase involved in cell wall biosynthesis
MWRFLLAGQHPPAVAVVHNPADHDAGLRHRLAARTVLKRCRALFTHARVLEAELAKAYPGRPTGSHPLPPAAVGPLPDAGVARTRLGLGHSGRLLVFLGLIRPYKGLDQLLQAMARLPEGSDWQLLVAGEPWGVTAAELEGRVQELGVAARVRLRLGWVPEPEVPVLLAAADLVALPYLRGSQSAVAPLALGAGVPVLSTRVGGLPEIIRHGTDGWLVEPGSPAAIVTALEAIDDERLAALTAGARDAAGRFTWTGYAAALEALIEQVIEET